MALMSGDDHPCIVPGPQIMTKQPQLFWGMIAPCAWQSHAADINLPLIAMGAVAEGAVSAAVSAIVLLSHRIYSSQFTSRSGDDGSLRPVRLRSHQIRFEPAPLLLGFVLGR